MHAKHFFFPTNVACSMPGLDNTSWTITSEKTSRIGRILQGKKRKRKTLIPDTAESRSSESYHFLTLSWEEKSRRHTGCLRKSCFYNAGAIQGKNTLIRTH